MAFIIKERARIKTAEGRVQIGFYPAGVGEMPTNEGCILLQIDKHRIFMTNSEWKKISEHINSTIDKYT